MRTIGIALALSVLWLSLGNAYAGPVRMGSWNMMRLGDGGEKSYPALALVVSQLDFVAIQEVMNQQGVDSLERAVEQRTGEPWTALCSSPAGSRSYKESYCFLTRDSAVKLEDGAVSFLDRKRVFMREPFSARFRSVSDGATFAAATVHIIYGKGPEDRVVELQELGSYWSWLEQIYPGEPIMLMGDFNMSPSHPAFAALRSRAVSLVNRGATTLSMSERRFVNLYDLLWTNPKARQSIDGLGVVNFPGMLGWSHAQARQYVSDHAPIAWGFGGARLSPQVQMAYTQAQGQRSIISAPAANSSVFAATDQQRAQPVAGSGVVHANRSSMIYHLATGCPSYDTISRKNLVVFSTEADAIRNQYRKAANCR